jgi:PHD/YefM family antitoxin component YafN of YafNO toxin-antitoxin module
MPMKRPISDLETNLPEITNAVHETAEPDFLTNKGYGNVVWYFA